MRKLMTAAVLMLASAATYAGQGGIVLAYECFHIDPAETGFKCDFNSAGEMSIRWLENPDSFEKKKKGFAMYQFAKIGTRFAQFGGRKFKVTAAHWGDGRRQYCTSNNSGTDFSCVRCTMSGNKCLLDGASNPKPVIAIENRGN